MSLLASGLVDPSNWSKVSKLSIFLGIEGTKKGEDTALEELISVGTLDVDPEEDNDIPDEGNDDPDPTNDEPDEATNVGVTRRCWGNNDCFSICFILSFLDFPESILKMNK